MLRQVGATGAGVIIRGGIAMGGPGSDVPRRVAAKSEIWDAAGLDELLGDMTPAEPRRKGNRKRGGQFGHRKHVRPAFAPEQIDEVIEYELDDHDGLQPLDDWRVTRQIELVERPFVITEHRARRYRCRRTGKIVTAPLPNEVTRGGLLGPRLTALVAYQKGARRNDGMFQSANEAC